MTVYENGVETKLHQLLLVALSSDSSGEIGAAVYAMRRIMEKTGNDIHAFAARLLVQVPALDDDAIMEDDEAMAGCTWQTAASNLLHDAPAGALSRYERDFLKTVSRYSRDPTPRQQQWLYDLVARVRRLNR